MKTQHDYWQEAHDWVMEEMKSDPLWGTMNTEPANTITCLAGGAEMLRVSPDGFWVRGEKVAQDDNEAQAVYNAFKAWMTWAQLNKDYQ
jgi:hypothetical protein